MERATDRGVPRDPMLPHLPGLLPDEGAPELVTRALRTWQGIEVDPAAGRVAYVGYRPTLSCTVLWSFATRSGGRRLVSGRMIRRGRGVRVAARGRARVGPGRVAPCVHLPAEGLVLEAFPEDGKLPGLVRAASSAWSEQRLAVALGLSGEGAHLVAEPVAYRPWQRCVLRYAPRSCPDGPAFYGKLFHDHQGEVMVAGLRELGAYLTSEGAPWVVPEPATYLGAERMLVTRELAAGRKLNRLLRPARKDPATRRLLLGHVARAARGLRVLQRAPVARLRVVTPRDLLDDFRRATGRIRRVEPGLAKRLGDGLGALERAAEGLPEEPLAVSHGAFRIDQLLPCGDRLGVLDLDTLCLAGESADAGNFLASLDAVGLRRPRLAGVLAECRSSFEEALGPPSPWLGWYRSASLVKTAFRSFLRLAPGWRDASERLLGRAHEGLARLA